MASSRQRANNQSGAGGCAAVFGVLLLVGLAVAYWYVALPIVAVIITVVAFTRQSQARRRRQAALHRPGPLDPWVNEVNVALHELDFSERARNQRSQIGGVPVRGQIDLQAKFLDLEILMLDSEQAAHRAEMALRADGRIRAQLERGRQALVIRDRALYLATARAKVVDEALLDEAVRIVDRLPVDAPAGAIPAPSRAPSSTTGPPRAATRAAPPPASGEDAIEQLARLSALHRDGTLSDEEFADKKAALLKRI